MNYVSYTSYVSYMSYLYELYQLRKLYELLYADVLIQLISLSLFHDCHAPSNLIESVARHMLHFQSFAVTSINAVPDLKLLIHLQK